jgi:hypothetical protein
MHSEPSRSHPVGPTGKRTENRFDTDRLVAAAMQPLGKVVDMTGGGAGTEPLAGNR